MATERTTRGEQTTSEATHPAKTGSITMPSRGSTTQECCHRRTRQNRIKVSPGSLEMEHKTALNDAFKKVMAPTGVTVVGRPRSGQAFAGGCNVYTLAGRPPPSSRPHRRSKQQQRTLLSRICSGEDTPLHHQHLLCQQAAPPASASLHLRAPPPPAPQPHLHLTPARAAQRPPPRRQQPSLTRRRIWAGSQIHGLSTSTHPRVVGQAPFNALEGEEEAGAVARPGTPPRPPCADELPAAAPAAAGGHRH